MCKLTLILALLSAATYGKGELSFTIKPEDDKEMPVFSSTVMLTPGQNFTLRCKYPRASPGDKTVTWYKKNESFQNLEVPKTRDPLEPSRLNFFPAMLDDRGSYVCKSEEESKKVYVMVHYSEKQLTGSKQIRNYYHYDVEKDDAVTDSKTDNEKDLMELLNAMGVQQGPDSTSAKTSSFNEGSNIDWNSLKEVNDNWPSDVQWLSPQQKFDYNFTELHLDDILDKPSYKFDDPSLQIPVTNYEYRSSFRFFYYTVPVSIILILTGVVRMCYLVGRKTNSGWERLRVPGTNCSHRMCVRRRNTNPSAGCMEAGRDSGRLSVLIIHRFTTIGTATSNNNNNEPDHVDAPPSYDDTTRLVDNSNSVQNNELPPSYTDVLANMNATNSTNLRDGADESMTSDVLPVPHSRNTQQV